MNLMGLKGSKEAFKMLFVLPLICDERNPLFLTNDCLKIYNEDTNKPEWGNDKIILCYKNGGNTKRVRTFLENHPQLYAKYTEYTDNYYTIYALHVPQKFKKDYEKILKGSYTKCSQTMIAKITGTWTFSELISGRINDVFMGLHSRINDHPATADILNLNQVPIKKG